MQKHLSLTNHAYGSLILVMNKAKFIVKDLQSKGIQVVEKVENAPFEAATKNVRATFAAKFAGSADVMKAVDAQR